MPLSPEITERLTQVASQFVLNGPLEEVDVCGKGLINDTYALTVNQGGNAVRYVLQRINQNVFKEPWKVMENIQRVTGHIKQKLKAAGVKGTSRRVLTLVPGVDGQKSYVDEGGNTWRVYVFIEAAVAHDQVATPEVAAEAARAFGEFQAQLADLPQPDLHETIKDFHNTRSRYDTFLAAIAADPAGRAAEVAEEIAWVKARESDVDVVLNAMADGSVPVRTTHNDTKINNVMLDVATSVSVCIMDLDTVMPGSVLYDFGDLVRATAISTAEDSLELDKVKMRIRLFEGLVRGYLEAALAFLTPKEIDLLAFSGKLITLETGIRFLTDYLNGDTYFKRDPSRPKHNLERFRVQRRLVESIEEQLPVMEAFVRQSVTKISA